MCQPTPAPALCHCSGSGSIVGGGAGTLTFPSPLSPAGAQPGHLRGHPDAGYWPLGWGSQAGSPFLCRPGRGLAKEGRGGEEPLRSGDREGASYGGWRREGGEGRALSASPTCRPQQAPFFWHSQPISWFSTLSPCSASLRCSPSH